MDEAEAMSMLQYELEADIEVVRRYGAGHPDAFGTIAYDGPRLRVEFTHDIDDHRRALASLVPHPDRIDVVAGTTTEADRARIRAEVEARLRDKPGSWTEFGETIDGLDLCLTARETALAQELHDAYGDALHLRVGNRTFPFAPGTWRPAPLPVSDIEWPGLEATIPAAGGTFVSGSYIATEVVLINRGSDRVRFLSGQLRGGVCRPRADVWAGAFSGMTTLEGIIIDLLPGEAGTLPATVGTASVEPNGPTLPTGTYELVVPVELTLTRDDGSFGERRQFVVRSIEVVLDDDPRD